MIELKDGLDRVAADAKLYGDLPAAIVTAHRRRRARRAVAAGIAVLAVAAAGVAVHASVRGPAPQPGASPTIATPAPTVTPPASAPPLPASGPVGRGAALYQPTPTGPIWLYTADGRWYDTGIDGSQLGARGDDPPLLSPDGRWLARQHSPRAVLRDLTTGTELTGPGELVTGWSPDSRYALFPMGGDVLTRLDLTTGQPATLTVAALAAVTDVTRYLVAASVTDGGELLVPAPGPTAGTYELLTVDPVGQRVVGEVPVNPRLPAGAANVMIGTVAGPDGRALVGVSWQHQVDASTFTPFQTRYLLVDPATGHQATVTGIESRDVVPEVLADRRDGLVVEYVTVDGEHVVPGVRVVLLDPATGRHRDLAYYRLDDSDRLFRLPGGGLNGS